MALVSLAQARAHVRVEDDYPAEQLEPMITGAEDAAQAYLNRAIYESAEALADARSGYVASVAGADAARHAAREAAADLPPGERTAALQVSEATYRDAIAEASRCIHGLVINGSVQAAILLMLGHLYANRSDVVVGAQAFELPQGAKALLRPYRRVMMP